MQRLARVFEHKGCIAFIGSGASVCLGYPTWKELLSKKEQDPNWESLRKALEDGHLEASQAIQIAEQDTDGRSRVITELDNEFSEAARKERISLYLGKHPSLPLGDSPFRTLMSFPISRFITTNYDVEIEKELKHRPGTEAHKPQKSFEQDDVEKLVIFSVALARGNQNMVFHCHGILRSEGKGDPKENHPENDERRRVILTDDDYNYWYLSNDSRVFALQKFLDVVLQSNPILFVGYSVSDADLLRVLRKATMRWNSERTASNLFLLLPYDINKATANDKLNPDQKELWSRAKQIKMGANLLPFSRSNGNTLANELIYRRHICDKIRDVWWREPRVKLSSRGPEGAICPRPTDPIFDSSVLTTELPGTLAEIQKNLDRDQNLTAHSLPVRVSAIVGPAGSGKLLKACQFARSAEGRYRPLVFHAYNNDDVYSYTKRIKKAVEHLSAQGGKPILVIINNVDSMLGMTPGRPWIPRNNAAKNFFSEALQSLLNEPRYRNPYFLLTAQVIYLKSPSDKQAYRPMGERSGGYISVPTPQTSKPPGNPFFTPSEMGLKTTDQRRVYDELIWHLQSDYSGVMFAASWLLETPMAGNARDHQSKHKELLKTVRGNTSEMGTRVVRHIVREMGRIVEESNLSYETLLSFLACFNTPISKHVFRAAFTCCLLSIEGASRADFEIPEETCESVRARLCALGLVQAIRNSLESEEDPNHIVHPLVKRYFRQVVAKAPTSAEMQACGLHGLLSRGPFNSPGNAKEPPAILFNYFARLAYARFENNTKQNKSKLEDEPAAHYIRAMIDLLRGNFACNGVPSWGKYRDYIDMLSITIDLLHNFARAADADWYPGHEAYSAADHEQDRPWFHKQAIASVEEMLHLYNELGLAYYNLGSVQDALDAWKRASEWNKVVELSDPDQSRMFAASINCHLGMAFLQLGRMNHAFERFQMALNQASEIGNLDLQSRIKGLLGRIEHFRGNIDGARKSYEAVITELEQQGNLRAKSYFMRHLAALCYRFGPQDEARRLAKESKAVAASQNAPDLVAYSAELEGRVLAATGNHSAAITAYRIAQEEALPLDISRLNADILLGIAQSQLKLGDAHAALDRAVEALALANEHLLVLRQAKALLIIGKAMKTLGNHQLATSVLRHAIRLAESAQFLLVRNDAEKALVEIGEDGRENVKFEE